MSIQVRTTTAHGAVGAWPPPWLWLDWANAPELASAKAPIKMSFFMVSSIVNVPDNRGLRNRFLI
jgi:hypothetical protein